MASSEAVTIVSELKKHDEMNTTLTREFSLLPFQQHMLEDLVVATPDGMLVVGRFIHTNIAASTITVVA